jgi:hypothetical protein
MEGTMTWDESDILRVMAIGGATGVVIVALAFANPLYSAIADLKAPVAAHVSQPVAAHERATEAVSFVASPVIDTNSEFFYGSGDGSSGYYAERPEPTPELLRYAQMPVAPH